MLLFFLPIIIILIALLVFDIITIKNLPIVNMIEDKRLQWVVTIMPIVIIFLAFNYINTFIILIHLTIFYFISKLIVYLIKRITKNEYSIHLTEILTISFTIIYLGIGVYTAYNVVETKYTITTNKEIGETLKIILISDSHIGTTLNGDDFYNHIKKLSDIDANLFIIAGDYVDDDTKKDDMIKACSIFKELDPKYGIYFVYGNHDKGYFNYRDFTADDLKNELANNNVTILEDEIVELNKYITLIGRKDKSVHNRKSITELVKHINKEKYTISINHQPNDYDNEMNNVDLVLSGHSHGGQMFPLAYLGKLTKANDEFYGLHTRGNTNFIVTSGISGWAADFKTGTKSEYVVIEIKKAN